MEQPENVVSRKPTPPPVQVFFDLVRFRVLDNSVNESGAPPNRALAFFSHTSQAGITQAGTARFSWCQSLLSKMKSTSWLNILYVRSVELRKLSRVKIADAPDNAIM
jgi:hypothetical protein